MRDVCVTTQTLLNEQLRNDIETASSTAGDGRIGKLFLEWAPYFKMLVASPPPISRPARVSHASLDNITQHPNEHRCLPQPRRLV